MGDGTSGGAGGNAGAAGGGEGGAAAASSESAAVASNTSESTEGKESVEGDKPTETTETKEKVSETKKEGEAEVKSEESPKTLSDQKKVWFPDDEFDNDDAYHSRIIDHVNDLSGFKTRNMESNKVVVESLRSIPELGSILKDVTAGIPFKVALAKHVDLSNIDTKEGDDDHEAYSKAKQERIDKLKESDDYSENVSKNQEESRKIIKQFFDDKKMSSDDVNGFVAFIDGIHSDMNLGKMSLDTLTHFFNAKNFTAEVDQAKELAEIAGKNKKVEFTKSEDKTGDGLPVVGQGNKEKETPKEAGPLDSMFESIEKKNDIYN